ncbi:uncharacterized protein LOC113296154 [Papaver somniferum]|uniref:uncharacterized protein LOC113296154 n=1 Tax=Papaver somniferum TaxID=3469 RepID=UPI000E6FD947|nr:uncharacterized protein LOC113296154 [Papaver somniferum]
MRRRSLAKDGARVKLNELYYLHKPDVICIAEPQKGGRPLKEIYINEFRSWISDNGLVEADAIGKKYTWSNCRSGMHRIVSKHDRAVINGAWHDKFANWRCKALPRLCSDHSPLVGFAFDSPRPKRAPFRIQKMWLSHPSFLEFVKDNWSVRLDGAPPFVFTSKLKRLREALKIWNRLVADARKAVDCVRSDLATMLKQKSRTSWLEDGDQNTRFFHNSIRMRRSQNTISTEDFY